MYSNGSLIKHCILSSVERTKSNENSYMILQNLNHSSKTVCMISCSSMYWIDYPDSILIEVNITRVFGTIA